MPARKPVQRSISEPAARYVTRPLSEVLWMAFQSLPEEDRNAFLQRLLADPELFEDIADSIAAKG